MESYRLLSDLEFHDGDPFAQPILVDKNVRILRWMLKPGQVVREHAVPGSPFHVVILKGRGLFGGPDGDEVEHGVGALLVFAPENPTQCGQLKKSWSSSASCAALKRCGRNTPAASWGAHRCARVVR